MEYQPSVPAAVAGVGGPRRDEKGFLVIPIQNIGVGPAINGKLEVLRTVRQRQPERTGRRHFS
jgi:hypothetical protein